MFFSDDLLTSKTGSLGIIWLMSTLGPRTKRLSKKAITGVEIPTTCELIAQPPEPMALRLSGHLLVGVARIFNQNYELFYSDVQNFNAVLRRSMATDFTSAFNGGPAGTRGIDLPGGGKSRMDQITIGDIDISLDSITGIEFEFGFVDWSNPIIDPRKRRATSKLSSMPTQPSQRDEDENSQDESEDEDAVRNIGRGRLHPSTPRAESQASLNRLGLMPLDGYKYTAQSLENNNEQDYNPVDLDIFQDNDPFLVGPNENFVISSDPFELPNVDHPEDMNTVMDQQYGSPIPDVQNSSRSPIKSAFKKRKNLSEDENSASDVDRELEVDAKQLKKTKKVKKVSFDQNLEMTLEEEHGAHLNYLVEMDRQNKENKIKEREKRISAKASAMVDGGGLWFQVFDPEMSSIFLNISQPGKFKWELETANHRDGHKVVEQMSPTPDVINGDLPAIDGGIDMACPNEQDPVQFEDYGLPMVAMEDMRAESEMDVEYGRRNSQASQQFVFPWEDYLFNDMNGPETLPGFDLNTPGRLSMMTPQEMLLRSKRSLGSGRYSLGDFVGRTRLRSRSGSLPSLGNDDLMLATSDDLDLPQYDINDSQPAHQSVFSPAMLASLEEQCRDFFTFVEIQMIQTHRDELQLKDVAPVTMKKRVAATAFYNCLTLATKRVFSLSQIESFGPITLRISAPPGITE